MAETSTSLPASQAGHHFASTVANNSYIHQGDVYNVQGPATRRQTPEEIVQYGLCLNLAPHIDPSYFIGRAEEIENMKEILYPGPVSTEQRRLVLGGIGGVGKTQLALAYAQRLRMSYSSVFWLNATSELTMKAGFRLLAGRVLSRQEVETLNDEQALARTLMWLADPRNTQWLLIFDNYDEPDQFNMDEYCPYAGHGSIVVTTRRPDLVTGRSIRVQHLTKMNDSLDILQTRSGRGDVYTDPDARLLVERMHGLPLALATAGAYLRQSTYTFQQYLQAYDRRWQIDHRRPVRLHEYQDRTLYTTWNLSYGRLEAEDPDAAYLLKLLAYFDNQEIWYELLRAGLSTQTSARLQTLLIDQDNFESVMRTLIDYCLVDPQNITQSYSIHTCVHDWTLGALNHEVDPQLYWYAFDCVAASTNRPDHEYRHVQFARVSRHGLRLTYSRFMTSTDLQNGLLERLNEVHLVADLLTDQAQFTAAEEMYLRALAGKEKLFGLDHILTLDTVNNLGTLYLEQDKFTEAEQMYLRALAGTEESLGPDHPSTLDTVHNLGSIYHDQGKLNEAEQMYGRALAGTEKALGLSHRSTLVSIMNLGAVYADQGKLDEAEQMYGRALTEQKKTLGRNHPSTLKSQHFLAELYRKQGEIDRAEAMYQELLIEYKTVLGEDHPSTLRLASNFGRLYEDQDKLDEAEHMFRRALVGYQKRLGFEHRKTRNVAHDLSRVERKKASIVRYKST